MNRSANNQIINYSNLWAFFAVQTGLHSVQTNSLRSQGQGKIEWTIIKTMERPVVLLAFVGVTFLALAAGTVNRIMFFFLSTTGCHNYGVYIYIYPKIHYFFIGVRLSKGLAFIAFNSFPILYRRLKQREGETQLAHCTSCYVAREKWRRSSTCRWKCREIVTVSTSGCYDLFALIKEGVHVTWKGLLVKQWTLFRD